MKWILRKLTKILKSATISKWKQSDKELTEVMMPSGKERPESFRASAQDGEVYQGIKITIPLPEKKGDL